MEVARRTDLFLFDLKMMDPERHKKWTGVSNEKILENLKALATTGVPIIIRIPLIGGVNDDTENLVETARFIAALSGEKKEVNILPYHKIAQTKYTKLGRPDDFRLLNEPDKDALERVVAIFQAFGIKATIG
jgi:pyruvate formate lyase activating enzyme